LIYNTGISLQGLREEAKFYELLELERLITKELHREDELTDSRKSYLKIARKYQGYFDE